MIIYWQRSAAWRQAQALLRGESIPEECSREMPATEIATLPEDLKSLLFSEGMARASSIRGWNVQDDGVIRMTEYCPDKYLQHDDDDLPAEMVAGVLRESLARAESRRAERAAEHAAKISRVTEIARDWLAAQPEGWALPGEIDPERNRRQTEHLPEDLRAAVAARIARRNEILAARKAEAEALKALTEAKKAAQLTEIINRLGNDNQRARHAAGLLPAREGWELLEAAELARFGEIKHVEAGDDITTDPTCNDEYCEGCKRRADEIEKLSAEEFEIWRVIEKRLPAGATHEFRRETATCSCGRASTRRTYVRADWTVGAYTIERDFPLGPETETEETED